MKFQGASEIRIKGSYPPSMQQTFEQKMRTV
jgi:hypothetical protein